MALFSKKQKTQVKKKTNCEYNEINVDKIASNSKVSKETNRRKVQLCNLFVILKDKYPGGVYTIDTPVKTFRIPEEFEKTEILAIAQVFEMKGFHLLWDEEHYVDIEYTTIAVNGELDMLEFVKRSLIQVAKIESKPVPYYFSFNTYSEWLWDKYVEALYESCVNLGNKYLTFGDMLVYDKDLDEFFIHSKEELDAVHGKEYVLLKSKLDEERIFLIDVEKRFIIGTGLNELEKEYVQDFLSPKTD